MLHKSNIYWICEGVLQDVSVTQCLPGIVICIYKPSIIQIVIKIAGKDYGKTESLKITVPKFPLTPHFHEKSAEE
jgi:hypothetical protein